MTYDNVGLTVDYRNFIVIFIPDQCQKHAMSASMYFIRRLNRENFFFRNFHVANYSTKFENSIASHSSMKLLAKVTGGGKSSYLHFYIFQLNLKLHGP